MDGGRPTIYSEELANKICDLIAESNSGLSTICKKDGFPSRSTVHQWIKDNKEFSDKYTRAKEDQADRLAEEILNIADDATNDFMTITKGDATYEQENKEWTSRSKLRVESRKWIASKLKPKTWGDKIQTEHSGSLDSNLTVTFLEDGAENNKS